MKKFIAGLVIGGIIGTAICYFSQPKEKYWINKDIKICSTARCYSSDVNLKGTYIVLADEDKNGRAESVMVIEGTKENTVVYNSSLGLINLEDILKKLPK